MAPSGNLLIAGISAVYLASTMGYVDTLRNAFCIEGSQDCERNIRRAYADICEQKRLIFSGVVFSACCEGKFDHIRSIYAD
jgi:hypothetical protein